jgi:hypothetical protein
LTVHSWFSSIKWFCNSASLLSPQIDMMLRVEVVCLKQLEWNVPTTRALGCLRFLSKIILRFIQRLYFQNTHNLGFTRFEIQRKHVLEALR